MKNKIILSLATLGLALSLNNNALAANLNGTGNIHCETTTSFVAPAYDIEEVETSTVNFDISKTGKIYSLSGQAIVLSDDEEEVENIGPYTVKVTKQGGNYVLNHSEVDEDGDNVQVRFTYPAKGGNTTIAVRINNERWSNPLKSVEVDGAFTYTSNGKCHFTPAS